jgi:hypothetical protein
MNKKLAIALDLPWLLLSPLLPGATNSASFRIYALRRSGHHAILNWIRAHIPGRHCLLNDCIPGKNPLASCSRGNSVISAPTGEHYRLLWRLEQSGWRAKKGTLLYNYEDTDFSQYQPNAALEQSQLGKSGSAKSILILRDPFNQFASKLRWARGDILTPSIESVEQLPALWKTYAREALGETEFLPNRTVINYNDWFLSREYRDRLGPELGFSNQDHTIKQVARFGPTTWGDSFDGLKYDGNADQMKVLERWKEYADDNFYRSLFDDPELRSLSLRLFPAMGTPIG